MPKRKLAALEKVDADLTNLQHKIKRDPASYRSEFQDQYLQYQNQREIFLANPTSTANHDNSATSFKDLVEFIAQPQCVAFCLCLFVCANYGASARYSNVVQMFGIVNEPEADLDALKNLCVLSRVSSGC